MKKLMYVFIIAFVFASCKKKSDEQPAPTPEQPKLIFKFKFDSNQERLNNFGQPSTIPAGNAAQSPVFNKMSAHYIELAQDSLTLLGKGTVLYHAAETTAGGSTAIDFDKSNVVSEGQTFFSVPLSAVKVGTYKWLRVSLAYQNYNISYRVLGIDNMGTVASFIGFNTYIKSFKVKDSTVVINGNKLQGYWAFETSYSGYGTVSQGDAPGTTVPNPIAATSPVPAGSCVVTGAFATPFTITGNETSDKIIVVSLSTNKSFEWKDFNGNGIYEPADGDTVVDMGIRGLVPIVQ